MVYPELYKVLSGLFRKSEAYTSGIIGNVCVSLPYAYTTVEPSESWKNVKDYLPESSKPEDWMPWVCVYYAVYGKKPGEFGATLKRRKKWFIDFINQLE